MEQIFEPQMKTNALNAATAACTGQQNADHFAF